MGGQLLSASSALACLPGPGDCIITEDEVILQHKGGTGAKNLIRTGWKMLEEHVHVLLLLKLSPDKSIYAARSYLMSALFLSDTLCSIISSTGVISVKI